MTLTLGLSDETTDIIARDDWQSPALAIFGWCVFPNLAACVQPSPRQREWYSSTRSTKYEYEYYRTSSSRQTVSLKEVLSLTIK